MRLPWVSRRAYDTVLGALDHEYAERTQLYQDWQAERARLIDTITSMQRAGFTPAPAANGGPLMEPLPAVIVEAIQARMDPSGKNGRETQRLARLWLDQGDDPEQIAGRILRGAEAEP